MLMKTLSMTYLFPAFPALTVACACLSGAVLHAQPAVESIYPDGSVQFQATNKLTFTLTSSIGIDVANVSVRLIMTNLDRTTSSQTLTSTNGLTVSGSSATRTFSAAISSNKVYAAVITATDAQGTTEYTNLFDTITASYTWESEDWDFESGKYIDNPEPNAYAGLVGVAGVDCFNPNGGGTAYRTNDTGNCGTEVNADIQRIQYSSAGLVDYDIGWTSAGQPVWANYTRHYPAGKWNIFLRAAGNPGGLEAAHLYEGGTNGMRLGRLSIPNTGGWQVYQWVPLTDIAGNLIQWDTDGSAKTLTIANDQGNWNGNFMMLMPVDPNYKPKPFISNFSPDASKQIFPTNSAFTFDVNSVPGISANDVVVTVNGIKPYGLSLTGSGRVLHGSFPLANNVAYKVRIDMTDANGSSTYNADFGTYADTNYTWELEDYDYDGAQYFDNPQTNAYAGLFGMPSVDANNNQSGGTSYRSTDAGDLPTEVTGDLKRAQYARTNDYNIGWTASGVWANYTRTYANGAFNVMLRAAGNSGGNDVARLLRVTSGVGTADQTTESLGQFNVPNTGGWQVYTWAPLVDSTGNLAVVTNTGSVSTFRMHENGGGWNGNFFMLVPVDTVRPIISQIYPNNQAMYQPTNNLSFVVKSSIPLDTNLVQLTLNGTVVPNLVFGGQPTNLTVSYPNLQPQTAYSGSIVVNTTNNDPNSVAINFNTLSSTNYTVEAEDYDYEGGKFIDNPPINAYAGLIGLDGVDAHNASTGGTAYRDTDSGSMPTEATGDFQRAEYAAASASDYNIGWTASGQWANYTRTYPTGAYNVMLRASSPGGQTGAASLHHVTSGTGTDNQTTLRLGTFSVPSTGSWQAYTFVPMVDTNNNLVTITNTGTVQTLRLYQDNGGWNANFFMFVPAQQVAAPVELTISRSGSNLTISWTPSGGTLYSSSTLDSSAIWEPVVGAANPMIIPIGSATLFYRVK